MACFHPWQASIDRYVDDEGLPRKRLSQFLTGEEVMLPCGKCVGCKRDAARQWATRLSHEALMNEHSAFVTLTYDDDHLPEGMNLRLRDFQLFMKRLRKALSVPYTDLLTGVRKRIWPVIRYLHVGEYGEQYGRPHYHALIFGADFSDKYLWRRSGEHRYYRSPLLERAWGNGNCEFGMVTPASAMYCLEYMVSEQPLIYDGDTGEVVGRVPPYRTMSRRPGIGRSWIEKYFPEVYNEHRLDYIVLDGGVKSRVPRYYDRVMDAAGAPFMDVVRDRRKARAIKYEADNTPERLVAKERVLKSRYRNRPRKF